MTLHRLGVNKRHLDWLAAQNLCKLSHHTLADTNIVRFDGGTGDMYYTLINHFHQLSRSHLRGLAACAHMHVRHASEHRVTFLIEFLPTHIGITVEHRTTSTTIRALHGLFRISHQIHDLATRLNVSRQSLLDGRCHRRAPTQGKDAIEILKHVKYNVAFQFTEFRLAVLFEILGDPHSRIIFDLIIGIGKRQIHHLRHFLADTCFARAHHADDHGDRPTHTSHETNHLICSGQEAMY